VGRYEPGCGVRTGVLHGLPATYVVTAYGRYHVLRLDRRIPEGTDPKLAGVPPQIRRRLRIRARKQMYAHEVERLRIKAQARGALDLP